MFKDAETKQWLLDGYKEMLDWLKPTKILWKGKVPEELADDQASGLICPIKQHNDKWHVVDGS